MFSLIVVDYPISFLILVQSGVYIVYRHLSVRVSLKYNLLIVLNGPLKSSLSLSAASSYSTTTNIGQLSARRGVIVTIRLKNLAKCLSSRIYLYIQ